MFTSLDFALGETADMIRETVEGFAQKEIAPIAARIDEENEFPNELWLKMGDLGLLGMTAEEQYGGTGLGYLEHVIAMEEISRASASVGRLVRRLRDATATFDPGPDAQWAHQPPRQYRVGSVGHNDVCVENVVFRAGTAHALIDFDWAGPSDPVWELASTARYWGPVEDPADAKGGFRMGDPVARIRSLVDGFDASETQRAALVPAIHDFLDWGEAHVESQSRTGHPGFRAVWESGFSDRRERARRWLSANADRISETLLDGNA